jgi:hypothetical protein
VCLADLRRHSLLEWLRHHSRWFIRAAAVLAVCYAAWIILNRSGPDPVTFRGLVIELLILVLIVGSAAWCGMQFIMWTLNSETLFIAVLRASLPLVLVYGFFLGLGVFVDAFKERLTPQGGVPTVFGMLYVIIAIPTFLFLGMIQILWAAVTLPLMTVCVLTIILWVSEFVFRRTAEHPGGFITLGLLLSAVTAVLVAVFK